MLFQKKINHRHYEKNKGFTLVELMAVMIILGLLGGVVVIGINSRVKKARIQATQTQISTLEQAISLFQLECGFYPESLDGLIAAPTSGRQCKGYPEDGFLKKKQIPADPWGKTYSYTQPGLHSTNSYDLWSNGPDGEEGTSDDITNWSSETVEE